MSRVTWFASLTLVLTTVHHVYGAYVYDTPWRLHAGIVAAVALAVILGAAAVVRRRPNDVAARIAFWTFSSVTLLVPVLGVGLFEGWYNHVLKNVLYFADAPASLLKTLFPPPAYEMPNNVFFEMTGIMQVVPGTLAGWYLYRLLRVGSTRSAASPSRLESGFHGVEA